MIATAIIVFREVLEAALVVGIVLAASQGVAEKLGFVLHRRDWLYVTGVALPEIVPEAL